MPPIEAALGREGARALWDSMRWAAGEIRALPGRHGFDIDYRAGSLWAAVRPRRVALLHEARDEAAQRWGYDALRVIPRDEMSEWIGSARYLAALHACQRFHSSSDRRFGAHSLTSSNPEDAPPMVVSSDALAFLPGSLVHVESHASTAVRRGNMAVIGTAVAFYGGLALN